MKIRDDPFLTPRQAAELLHVSRSHIYRLIHSGAIPSLRVGQAVRIPLTALRDYISTELPPRLGTLLLRELDE